jgi:hypothetical protein
VNDEDVKILDFANTPEEAVAIVTGKSANVAV